MAGGGKGVKDGKGGKKKKKAEEEGEEEEETYYDAMKKDMGDRAARTKVLQLGSGFYSFLRALTIYVCHTMRCTCQVYWIQNKQICLGVYLGFET